MAEAFTERTVAIPGAGRTRRDGVEDTSFLSKSVPTSFYSKRKPPPAPRHRPLRSKEDPESLQLPPPSPLENYQESLLLGRSLTKTTPNQLLYPASLPSRFAKDGKRLKEFSLIAKKPDFVQDDASPSSSVHSKEDTEHEDAPVGSHPVGSLSSTLYQLLDADAMNSNERVSVLTGAHQIEEDDRDEPRTDGIFEMEDD